MFFFTRGNFLLAMWHYPVAQVPVLIASSAVSMNYYHISTWDIALWACGDLIDAFSGFSIWLIQQLGEPDGKFVATMSILYLTTMLACIFGILAVGNSRCDLSRMTRALRGFWICAPVPIIGAPNDTGGSGQFILHEPTGASTQRHLDSPRPPIAVPDSVAKLALVSQPAIAVSDTSSVDSIFSSLGDSVSTVKRVCQAHFLRYDRIDVPVWP